MKFYNRDEELRQIKKIVRREDSDFIYIYGRRRIGKTSLILKSLEKEKFLYFFVGEKSQKELLMSFQKIIEEVLDINYVNFNNFRELLDFLFEYAKQNNLIVVFDEFQNFYKIDKSFFSDLQYFWDLNNKNINIKLFCLGSHFTLMKEIFENYNNPLFGRKTGSFYLKSFNLNTQIRILDDNKNLNPKNLLYFYGIFGGIPKYIEIFLKDTINIDSDQNKISYNEYDFLDIILNNFVQENSFFFFEGKELFFIEFGKSFNIYFSILGAIANGKNKKGEISIYTGISIDSIGFYLKKLESYFKLIDRKTSIGEKKVSKVSYYHIKDTFLVFWFRYIYKYSSLLEIKKFEKLREFIKTDINIFLGFVLEDLFKQILIEINLIKDNTILPFEFFEIGNLLTKSNIEIDIVLLNKSEKKVLFIESKLNTKKITPKLLEILKEKVEKSGKFKDYDKQYGFVSLEKGNFSFQEDIFIYSVEEFLQMQGKIK